MAKPGLHLTVNCEYCAKPFRQWGSNQRYCSRLHGTYAWKKRQPKKGRKPAATRACAKCGIVFKNDALKRNGSAYCSSACGFSARADLTRGTETAPRQTCEVCGGKFYAPLSKIIKGGGKFCGNECRGRFVATHPECFAQTRTRRGRGGRRDDLGGAYFRSSWEANYARYLNLLLKQGLLEKWEFEVDTFEFPVKRGSRFYTPDFKVWGALGGFEYHEIKGYMDPRSKTKLDRMARHFPAVRVVLIDRKKYYDIQRSVAAIIPTWEARR